ncbi:MAG: tRNA preQ1(34) S-adenosylmethionine ribosyltransferase-isomerase QueA [Candidatus Omnitrophica bacterium]|nr:tRNA preQ1(34) S-adenosylmethionine ribosyltransferase-isomerase QueA [Candidatus Omnitrophota bacterium]
MDRQCFYYALPEKLIAQHPLHHRDQARLMIIDRKKKTIEHDIFSHIDQYFSQPAIFVLNNSKVLPARLLTNRQSTGGVVELFLLEQLEDEYCYRVLMRPMRRLKEGEVIFFPRSRLRAVIIDKEKRIVRFNTRNIKTYLNKFGHIPLPPYIKRLDTPEDRKYYQTVYAKKGGSVASPTAGLHFTQRLLNKLKRQGHEIEEVTLHVSYGTFQPVEERRIEDHPMHTEQYQVNKRVFHKVRTAKLDRKPIVSVGTTSCRTLESLAKYGKLAGKTDIFIYPGYAFQYIDALITNFHLPYSTLLMLVYAFGGETLMREAYQEAIKKKYRFFSYGDAMLIM